VQKDGNGISKDFVTISIDPIRVPICKPEFAVSNLPPNLCLFTVHVYQPGSTGIQTINPRLNSLRKSDAVYSQLQALTLAQPRL